MGKVHTPHCRYCLEEVDVVHYAFFNCSRFVEEKGTLTCAIKYIDPETIMEAMLKFKEKWQAVVRYSAAKTRKGISTLKLLM